MGCRRARLTAAFLAGSFFLGRLLSRSFLLGRRTRTAPAARWRGGRRYSGSLTGHRYGDLVVLFLYQNGFLFLFFLFLQILFQRFAEGAAVTVFIRLIVPTVESRIIEAHISS